MSYSEISTMWYVWHRILVTVAAHWSELTPITKLVQTSKALKMAAKGSRPTPASLSEASSSINSSISSSYYSFNYALDDLEHEIVSYESVPLTVVLILQVVE